jgi:hypothetical protein
VRDTRRADRSFFRPFLMSLVSRSLFRLPIFSASERVEEDNDGDAEYDHKYDSKCVHHLLASHELQSKANQDEPDHRSRADECGRRRLLTDKLTQNQRACHEISEFSQSLA